MLTRRKSSISDISALVVSQGPIDDPRSGVKSLAQVKPISLDKFIPSPDAEEEVLSDVEKTLSERLLFHPEGYVHMVWDISAMLLILYQAVSVPFMITFDVQSIGVLMYVDFLFQDSKLSFNQIVLASLILLLFSSFPLVLLLVLVYKRENYFILKVLSVNLSLLSFQMGQRLQWQLGANFLAGVFGS